MENLHLNSRYDLQRYVDKHVVKRLGIGREGNCILLDNGYVLKCLCNDYNPDFALQFKDVDIKSFIFARYGVFLDDYVIATFMDYANGDILQDKKPVNQDIDTLGTNLETLVQDIIVASDMGIIIKDFHVGNIAYDLKQFKIIDTLPYLYFKTGNYRVDNLREVMNRMYVFLLKEIMDHREVSRTTSFWGRLDALEKPKEYLGEVKDRVESLTGEKVKTLGEAANALEKMR